MNFLDYDGLTHLWEKISSAFMKLPSNNKTAKQGTVLTKSSSGYTWENCLAFSSGSLNNSTAITYHQAQFSATTIDLKTATPYHFINIIDKHNELSLMIESDQSIAKLEYAEASSDLNAKTSQLHFRIGLLANWSSKNNRWFFNAGQRAAAASFYSIYELKESLPELCGTFKFVDTDIIIKVTDDCEIVLQNCVGEVVITSAFIASETVRFYLDFNVTVPMESIESANVDVLTQLYGQNKMTNAIARQSIYGLIDPSDVFQLIAALGVSTQFFIGDQNQLSKMLILYSNICA